jgi:hypothetical protein
MCTYPKNHFSSLHRPLLPATYPSPPNPEPRVAPALYAALRNMKQNKARRKKERKKSFWKKRRMILLNVSTAQHDRIIKERTNSAS